MNHYKLLRNNKESGPFTASQLIGIGFKAYDLIWQEGKSAAWRYPSEIEEFKNHAPQIEEQPFDRFYKKNISQTDTSTVVAETIVTTTATVVKKDKPRIKIVPEWKKMEAAKTTPPPPPLIPVIENKTTSVKISAQPKPIENRSATINTTSSIKNTADNPSWQEAWLNWEKERKTMTTLSKQNTDAPPALETKFSQSLDSIKERYVESVLNKKTKQAESAQFKNYITVAAIALVLICGGIWLGAKNTKTNTLETTQNTQAVAANNDATAPTANSVSEENTEPQPEPQANNKASVTIVPMQQEAAVKKTAVKKNTATAAKKIPSNNDAAVVNNSSKTQKQANKKIVTPVFTPQQQPVASASKQTNTNTENMPKAVFKKQTAEPKISDYVSLTSIGSADIAGTQYHIQNTSDIPIELVMVDLQYFNSSGGFVKGETIYVKNLAAGETATANPPANKNAAKVTAKVSMITSTAKDLYLIAD